MISQSLILSYLCTECLPHAGGKTCISYCHWHFGWNLQVGMCGVMQWSRRHLKWLKFFYCPDSACLLFHINEPAHGKTYKMACAPSKDSDQPGHPPSLIRVFAVRMKKVWVLSYLLGAQRRRWSDWADAQADLSFRWAHMPFFSFCRALANLFILPIFL